MADLHELLILEDAALRTMAGSPTFLAEFPFLKSLNPAAKRLGSCGRCSRAKAQNASQGQVVNSIKMSLLGMNEDRKKRLKTLLRTKQVRIRISNAGKVQDHTF